MQIKTNELINFSHYCSENSLKFPSERISNLIKFLQKEQHDNFERDISFIYSLLPSTKEEKEKLKELIHQYFNFLVGDYKDQSSFLLDYKDERVEDFFNDNSLSRFQKLADDIIKEFTARLENVLSTNNLTNLLEQLKQSKKRFHIHSNSIEDILTSKSEDIFYICDHC